MSNMVIVSGNLTRKNYREGNDNKQSLVFVTVATPSGRRTEDGKTVYNYIEGRAFGRTADFLNQYFEEGSPIETNGELTSSVTTGQDGKKVYSQTYVIRNVGFAPRKWEARNTGAPAATQPAQATPADDAPMTADPIDDMFDGIDDDVELPFN